MATDPVIISGAGPSGLILGLTLAKNGIPVRIVDKEPGPRAGEKGAGITPRSLELHRLLGTLSDIMNLAKGIPTMRVYDPADPTKVLKTQIFIPTLEPTPQTPYINPAVLGQPYQERIFVSHLERLGVRVEYGSELRSFEQSEDAVTGEIVRRIEGQEVVEKFKAPWLVGADGSHSLVRKTLGLNFLGETREDFQIVIADVKLKALKLEAISVQFWELWGDRTTKTAHLRPSGQDDGIAQLMIAGPQVDLAKVSSSPENVIASFYEITGRHDIVIEDVVWLSRYRPNIRMVNQLRVGRVFVAGDAAHCHSPTGGQVNLAWKLSLVYKGFAPATLLDTYAEERLPIIAEMLGKTTELLNKVAKDGNIKRGSEFNQLGVNYRGSSIVYEDDVEVNTSKGAGYNDDSVNAARPGDRAPDAPGLVDVSDKSKAICIYDLYAPNAHTVLVFSATAEGHSPLFEVLKALPEGTVKTALILPNGAEAPVDSSAAEHQFDYILVDQDGYAYTNYHVDHSSVAVIRPDGVVGARVLGAPGLKQYFNRIFAHGQ
ncbi:hypothetical protein CVT26_007338 [Gymnopilus dilepis]|uniref:FAD-binding domain-containing protein n=1 Tax=Gymnopilus dilepis TaxID=231916 RepID=A0A409VP64_9AGAR|nr:hypothetical protein CVT26_007338 [Gymnopilus dilepis]